MCARPTPQWWKTIERAHNVRPYTWLIGVSRLMGDGAPGKLAENFYFAGQDRGGVLNELERQLRGEPGAVPDVKDHLNSLAISFAALKSMKEQRKVLLSEIF